MTCNVTRLADAPSFWFMGIQATIVSRGEGGTTILELVMPPGLATPLHVHDDDEDSGVLVAGTLAAWCDGELHEIQAGSWLSLPRARPHAKLVIGTSHARVIAVYTNTHFADFIAEVGTPIDRPRPAPPSPADFPRLREIAARHNMRIMGPAPAELLALRAG